MRKKARVPDGLPLATERLLLRRLTPDDLAAFQAYRTDPEVGRYQGWSIVPDAQARVFLAQMRDAPLFAPGGWCQIGIAERDGDEIVGDVGVCVAADGTEAEIGFSLARGAQGRGLATEAVAAVIALVFERTDVARIVAIVDARNTSSIRLLERLGMTRLDSSTRTFRGSPCIEHRYVLARP